MTNMKAMRCPKCGEKANCWLKGEVSAGDDYMIEELECGNCDATWQNTYTLTKQEVVKP